MKRYSLAVILGFTVMLLALAPQLRADATHHFNYGDHGNAATATHSDNDHDWNTAEGMCSSAHSHTVKPGSSHDDGESDHTNTNGSCNGGSSSSSSSGSGSTVSTPEPSSLFLLLSGFAAAMLGMALKKTAA